MSDLSTDIQSLDKWTFSIAVFAIAAVALPLLLAPSEAAQIVERIYDIVTRNFVLAYLWYGIAALIFLLYLGFSRFGHARLGPEDSRPEYATLSWIGMIFC